jgi:hypothetical protein
MEQDLSCDEQVIPFKGRSTFKAYNPKKPHKWGYKMWILSGVSGFSYKFELCAGNQGYVEVPNEPDFEAASNVVVRMARKIPNNMHHKLYYDNYFSSLPLVGLSVRLKNFNGMKEKQMKQRGRGSMQEQLVIYENTNIHVIQWFESRKRMGGKMF